MSSGGATPPRPGRPAASFRLPARLAAGLLLGIVASAPCLLLILVAALILRLRWVAVLPPVVLVCTIAGLVLFRPARTPRRVYLKVRGRMLALAGHVLGGLLLAVACMTVLVVIRPLLDVLGDLGAGWQWLH